MKTDCLNERNLILLHYGEPLEGTTPQAAAAHLTLCAACRTRQLRLASDLARIPAVEAPDPAVTTRLVARVGERLAGRQRRLPILGAMGAGAVALALALAVWIPDNQLSPTTPQQQVTAAELPFVGPPRPVVHEAALDLDLLEQLDLLEELETLRDIEGV